MTSPTNPPPHRPSDYPGRTLGIVGFVLSFVMSIAGLVISIIAIVQSRHSGHRNGLALAGIIISGVSIVIAAIMLPIAIAHHGATWCAGPQFDVHTLACIPGFMR